MRVGRRIGAALRLLLAAAPTAVPWMQPAAALAPSARAASAKLVSVAGTEERGYGRIALTFDTPVAVKARVSGAVLVLSFARPASLPAEKLAGQMPRYVSVARGDPDGTGMRAALQGGFRVNVLEAGEKTFVDLLPPDWTGLLPGLPPDVVADLARRAQAAEARLRREDEARTPPPPVLPVRVAHLPTLLRLSFPVPPEVEPKLTRSENEVTLRLGRPFRLDDADARGQLAPAVEALAASPGKDGLEITLRLAEGFAAQGFRDDDGYVLDVRREVEEHPPAKSGGEANAAKDVKAREAKGADAKGTDAKAKAGAGAESPHAALAAPAARGQAAIPLPAEAAAETAPASGPVRAILGLEDGTTRLSLPLPSRTAAALFERGGVATLVLETGAEVVWPPLPVDGPLRLAGPPRRQGGFLVTRFQLPEPRLIQLASTPGGGWTMSVGEARTTATGVLSGRRARDPRGQGLVTVPLPRPGGVLWLEGGDERIAVATAFGPGAAGVPKRQRFVEFEILPSAQGAVVLAGADDLTVRPGLEGVTIGRETGLTLSASDSEPTEPLPAAGAEAALAIDRDAWATVQGGDLQARLREAMNALVAAPYAARPAARLDLAHLLIAARNEVEADGVLSYAERDDPTVPTQRRFLLLKGIGAARIHRNEVAAQALSASTVVNDPEARLWRALLDVRNGRWGAALAAIDASDAILARYPDDLRADFALLAAQAAVEKLDLTRAETAIEAATPLASRPAARERLTLLRARLDAEAGRPRDAADALRRLADTASRPVAAEAELRWTELALTLGSVPRDEAIARLERLGVAWRGDTVEIRTLVRLARLYAEAGRWREAFVVARAADNGFTDHEQTRALHAEMVQLFEDLFLSDRAADLSRVASVALYFDFKEFSPVGRRGDDIVRRIADRLVELDLLESAANLLQYQIDHRLTGAARAGVATRLAAIRLADGKPMKAMEVLRATRLAELPAETKRARMLLEARALSDLSRTELALDLIADDAAPDARRLRADVLWSARRWREAGEAHEGLVGERWRGEGALSETERGDVLRAALAYGLASEPLGLDRLRAKYAAKMSESVDARTFALLCAPNASAGSAFRDLARRATGADTLTAFLRDYRKRYPEMGVPERLPEAERAPAAPQAAAAGGASPPG